MDRIEQEVFGEEADELSSYQGDDDLEIDEINSVIDTPDGLMSAQKSANKLKSQESEKS